MDEEYELGFTDAIRAAIEIVENMSKAEALAAFREALEDDDE